MKLNLERNQVAITKIVEYILQIAPTSYRDLRTVKRDKFIVSILYSLGLLSYLTYSKGTYNMCILFRDYTSKRKGVKCYITFDKHCTQTLYSLGNSITYNPNEQVISIGGNDDTV